MKLKITIELVELLEFLRDWLAPDHGQLSGSLTRFVGCEAYGLETIRADLANFAFLLGGNDGGHLLAPDANSPEF